MTPLNHRSPGIVGAALAHGDYCELIPDFVPCIQVLFAPHCMQFRKTDA